MLARTGERLPSRAVDMIGRAAGLVEVGAWVKANGHIGSPRFDRREGVWDTILAKAANERVLYLEFGVFEGAATRWWAERLKNPETRMIGFDTFEGLPERWNTSYDKGHFDVDGQLPRIDDSRVSFEKGLFSDTLPHVKLPEHDVLVLNMDADLYSSTIYVLRELRDAIKIGTYIYFDEFFDAPHELRAFREFMSETGYAFEMVAATKAFQHAAFIRVR
ncbi:MAG TPA: TylF/MycF/NovP-related O-methyltransferase [Sphingomonas sp.]|nr:TylF/MycF/NovP-related O-methyltransferase [Sphingomonas sp.]